MDLKRLKGIAEAKAPKWDVLYGKLMDQGSNVSDAMGDGKVKAAKAAADKMLVAAKALHKEIHKG